MQPTTNRRVLAVAAVALALTAVVALVGVAPPEASAAPVVTPASAVATVAAATAAQPSTVTGDPADSPTVTTSATGLVTATDPSTGLALTVKAPAEPKATTTIKGAAALATDPSAYTVVTPETGGLQLAQDITGPSAPSSYAYKLKLPAGYSPYVQPDGTIALETDAVGKAGGTPTQATTLGFIGQAWATDANGQAVPTSYTVKGDAVTQHVDLSHVSAFPVVADPKVTLGWVVYVFFSKGDLQAWLFTALVDGAGAAAGAACAFASEVPPVAIACAGLVAFVWSYFHSLFQTAVNRNGGIVLEFTYSGTWWGYLYAGSWS